jgi:Na+/melibiose symporter-like transporter
VRVQGREKSLQQMNAVPVRTKVAFGFGEIATATKGYAMNVFLFYYYTQALGLDPGLAGLALGIAVVFDGINDPMIGSVSDNSRSRLGRRHPFMYFSAVPLCFSFYCLFMPLEGLSGLSLFAWLTTFAVLARTFMTFFQIPHTAFGAELSSDYGERSRIMSYATLFGWIGGVGFSVTCYTLIFARTEDLPGGGLLNPDHYFEVAALGVVMMLLGIVISSLCTQKAGRSLARPTDAAESFGLRRVSRELLQALRNRNFRLMFSGIFVHGALGGIAGVMGLHMQTYFWGLKPSQIYFFSFSGLLANFVAFALIQAIAGRFEKKHILICMALFGLLDSLIVISLRLVGWFPENGDPILLPLIVATWTLGATAGTIALIMGRSIIADTVDEQELVTGQRQEGMFFSSIAFSAKAVSGIGTMAGGFVLSLIGFPGQVTAETVPPDAVFRMGVFMGPILACFYTIPILIYAFYRLDRRRLTEIQSELRSMRLARAAAKEEAAAAEEVSLREAAG